MWAAMKLNIRADKSDENMEQKANILSILHHSDSYACQTLEVLSISYRRSMERAMLSVQITFRHISGHSY